MALTKKQLLFANEYLKDCNGTQAAIRAGYSKKTARYASQWINEKNLQKPTSKYIPELKKYIDEQLEKIKNEQIADAEEVITYLSSVMRGETKSEVVVVELAGDGTSKAKNIKKLPDEKERLKAAELLGKRYGMFKDNVNMEITTPIFNGEDELEE